MLLGVIARYKFLHFCNITVTLLKRIDIFQRICENDSVINSFLQRYEMPEELVWGEKR